MSKIRYYLIFSICLIIIINTVRSFDDYFRAGGRVAETERKLDAAQRENEQLLKQKREVDGADFVEKEARNRLGMSLPGETIVVLPEELQNALGETVEIREPNWKKWWRLVTQ